MRKEDFAEVLGDINENYIQEAETIKRSKKPVWPKWGAMAACLCLVIGLTMPTVLNMLNPKDDSAGTLMGDTEIYPTVMVDGQLYEWRKGAAIRAELPNNSAYYGEVTHVEGKTPRNNCEFVSVFSVSGQIYTISENDECVYLCLTTDWLNETVVVFDLMTNSTATN